MAKDINKERKEDIQQNPAHVDDKNKKPVTPEPPQRKDPGAKPSTGGGNGKK